MSDAEAVWVERAKGLLKGELKRRGLTYADLAARVRIWLDELTGPTVAAAHGGVARALMVLIGGVAPADSFANPIHQGRALVFANGRGRWV